MSLFHLIVKIDSEFDIEGQFNNFKIEMNKNNDRLGDLSLKLQLAEKAINVKREGFTGWSASNTKPKDSIDPLSYIQPGDVYSEQLVELYAKSAAIEDCLYYLEKAFSTGKNSSFDFQTYLKKFRELSREQFLCKLHINKIKALQNSR